MRQSARQGWIFNPPLGPTLTIVAAREGPTEGPYSQRELLVLKPRRRPRPKNQRVEGKPKAPSMRSGWSIIAILKSPFAIA